MTLPTLVLTSTVSVTGRASTVSLLSRARGIVYMEANLSVDLSGIGLIDSKLYRYKCKRAKGGG